MCVVERCCISGLDFVIERVILAEAVFRFLYVVEFNNLSTDFAEEIMRVPNGQYQHFCIIYSKPLQDRRVLNAFSLLQK